MESVKISNTFKHFLQAPSAILLYRCQQRSYTAGAVSTVGKMAAVIKLAVFDLAGTTVDDTVDGLPLVTVAIREAFKKYSYDVDPSIVNKYRGMEKKEAMKGIAREVQVCSHSELSDKVETLFEDFKIALNNHLWAIDKEIPGTTEIFRKLKSQNIKVAVGSGFPSSVVETIVTRLGWSHLVDYVTSAEKEGHGRPNPAMIQAAMKSCGIVDSCQVVKVGDSKVDIEEGRNAKCWTVAVLTGTQSQQTLAEAKPDFIVDSVANLLHVIAEIANKA